MTEQIMTAADQKLDRALTLVEKGIVLGVITFIKCALFVGFFPLSLIWLMLRSERNTAFAVKALWLCVKALLFICFFPLSLLFVGSWWGKRQARKSHN